MAHGELIGQLNKSNRIQWKMTNPLTHNSANPVLVKRKFVYAFTSCCWLLLPFALFILMSSVSCKNNPEELVSPTTGKLNIMADENIQDIVEQERDIFESTYRYAKLSIKYDSEYNTLNSFFNDSMDVIFTTRALTNAELDFFKKKKIYPRQIHFASGALAFISSKQAQDTSYSYEDFLQLLKDSTQGKIFVIENAKSGIANQIMQTIGKDQLPAHFFAKSSKEEVIQYVQQHPESIGIIDYSAISDSDASYSNEILNSVQLIGIARPKDSLQKGYLRPFQYNLQDKFYPFTRELYYITKTGLNDVSTGFIAFIAGDIGQKIVLKAGLLPVYQTERWIELKSGSKPKIEK